MSNSPSPALLRSAAFILRGWKYRNRQKIFCVGRNKTGTTSMARIFRELGIPVGAQRKAELLAEDWGAGDFRRIIHYVRYGGVAFQDVPFSLPGTYAAMDRAFPGSKFILTVRDSSDVWYKSLTRFHAQKFGHGQLPTKEDFQQTTYVRPGWAWAINRFLYDTPEDDLYHEASLKASYEAHNQAVTDHFREYPERLLVVNLKEEDAAQKISKFLATGKMLEHVPWENKS